MTPPTRRPQLRLRKFALAIVLLAASAVAMAQPAHTQPARAAALTLARGDFEAGLAGWRGYRARVRLVRHGRSGRAAEVRLRRSRRGAPSFSIFVRTSATTAAGTHYVATASMRGVRGAVMCLRVHERRVRGTGRCVRATGRWQRFTSVRYTQHRNSSRLSVAVIQLGTRRSKRFRADQIKLTARASTCQKPCARSTATGSTTPTNPGGTSTAPPTTQSASVGAEFHCGWSLYTNPDRENVLDKLRAAGITWVRIDMGWAGIEDTGKGARNAWYIGMMDFCINAARARGINVLVTLWMTPGWANGGRSHFIPPANAQDYADFARWAADHWAGRVAAWEVWNEPDPYQSFWQGSTAQYVSLLTAAYPAFKAGDRNAKVVLGGASSNDDAWLAQLYSLRAKGSFDVVATHPYQGLGDAPPETPDDGHRWWFTHVAAVRNVMVANGDGEKGIWFTEFGWSAHANWTGIPSWQRGVTPEQQGDYFVRAVKLVRANYPYVGVMFWYKERANPGATDVHEEGLGLLNADMSERPALVAIRAYLTR